MGIKVDHVFKRGLLMPHPTPLPLRQVIVQRAEQGQSVTTSARSSAGSSVGDCLLRQAVVDRAPNPNERNGPTKSGRWMLRTKSLCATALRSVGSASSMNAAARSSKPQFSPLAYWNTVPVGKVQAVLRHAFQRWGRPQRFRVDNGTPWGSVGDLPTDLALWLLGLDVGISPNPPRRPQDNGVVERSQGTGKR